MSDPVWMERCAAAVHRAYCENYLQRNGEPYWTGGNYEALDDATKEIDRATVRAVWAELTSKWCAMVIDGVNYPVPCEVMELIRLISVERDELKAMVAVVSVSGTA